MRSKMMLQHNIAHIHRSSQHRAIYILLEDVKKLVFFVLGMRIGVTATKIYGERASAPKHNIDKSQLTLG